MRNGITAVALECDQERLFTVGRHIKNEVHPLCRGKDKLFGQRLWLSQRHTVERHDPSVEPLQPKCEHPRIGGVDQPQPHAVTAFYRVGRVDLPIGQPEIADAPRMAEVVEIVEGRQTAILLQTNVVDHQGDVLIHIRRIGLVDDQRAV